MWQFDNPERLSTNNSIIRDVLVGSNSIIRNVLVRDHSIIRNVLVRNNSIIRDVLVGSNSIIHDVLVCENSIIRNVLVRDNSIIGDVLVGKLVVVVICGNEILDSSLHVVPIALFATTSTTTVGPIQPLSQWLPGVSSSVIKLPKCNACHPAP